jgi:hypothetical protein
MLKNGNKTDVFKSQCYSYGEYFSLYLIFCKIWDNLTTFSRIHGVETVNLSPPPLFYAMPNVHNFVTKISLRELYNRIGF